MAYLTRTEAREFGYWARDAAVRGDRITLRECFRKVRGGRPYGAYSLAEEFRGGWVLHRHQRLPV